MLSDLLLHLIVGDGSAIAQLFDGGVSIDSPASGAVTRATLEDYVAREQALLGGPGATTRVVATIRTPLRDVAELLVDIGGLGATELPIALVGERAGSGLRSVRVYHSTWPLTGRHALRPPIIQPSGPLDEPPIITRYFEALARGDAPAILDTFAPEASLREPSGVAYAHVGREALAAFYAQAFSEPGGVPLTHVSATFDGRRFAVEYLCDRWGSTSFPPMAGCAVYDLTEDRARIAAVRIYDDVSPPAEG